MNAPVIEGLSEEFIRKNEKYLKIIRGFRLLDDDFMSKVFEDGSHILYVNAQCRSDTPLGKLMHDFHCTDARDMNYPVLAERVHYFKDNVKGATNMCRAVEQLVKDERVDECLGAIRALMESMAIPAEKAMQLLKVPETEWTKYKELLANAEK